MTETVSEEDYVPVSAELILAAVLKTLGLVSIPTEALMQSYDQYQIKIDQEVEDFITLQLVEVSNDES
jgi:hypothetical protein